MRPDRSQGKREVGGEGRGKRKVAEERGRRKGRGRREKKKSCPREDLGGGGGGGGWRGKKKEGREISVFERRRKRLKCSA